MAKSIDIILITYKQSRRDARPQSRCAVKRNACQTTTDHHRSPVGTTELCRAYSALIGLWIILAGIPCLRTSYLSKSVTLTGFRFIWWRLLLDYMTVHYIELRLCYITLLLQIPDLLHFRANGVVKFSNEDSLYFVFSVIFVFRYSL